MQLATQTSERKNPPLKPKGEKKKKKSKGGGENLKGASQYEQSPLEALPEPKIESSSAGKRSSKKKSSSKRNAPMAIVQSDASTSSAEKLIHRQAAKVIVAAMPNVADELNVETVEDEDDGYGDDFENYSEEEFEVDDDHTFHATKMTISGVKRAVVAAGDDCGPRDLAEMHKAMREENAAALERRKEGPPSRPPQQDETNDGYRVEQQAGILQREEWSLTSRRGVGAAPAKRRATPVTTREYLNLGAQIEVASKLSFDDPRVLRGQTLKSRIGLQRDYFKAFEQAPLGLYDLYRARLCSRLAVALDTVHQTGCQSNEDDRSVEVQTDDIAVNDGEVQFQCGDDTRFETMLTAMKRGARWQLADVLEYVRVTDVSLQADSPKIGLSGFLRNSSEAIEGLLAEARAAATDEQLAGRPMFTRDIFSMFNENAPWLSLVQLVRQTESPLVQRGRCCIQGSMVLSIYFMSRESNHPLEGKAVICIWDLLVPDYPAHVLVADGDVTCACFADGQTCIVLAGSREGNIFAWDLRQAMSARALQTAAVLGIRRPVRFPSVGTHLSDAYTQIHTSSVVTVTPIPSIAHSSRGDLTFQFSSVDDRGHLCFWLLSESHENRNEGWEVKGHSLEAGSTIRLTCSRSLYVYEAASQAHVSPPQHWGMKNKDALLDSGRLGPSVLGIACLPWEPSQFLVQKIEGGLLHGSRFANLGLPKQYKCDGLNFGSQVTAVHFSPFARGYFLAGCRDGSIRLYCHTIAHPLVTWSSFCVQYRALAHSVHDNANLPGIEQVQWSPQRPAVFYVLDTAGRLHTFDLLQEDKTPIITEGIESSGQG